MAWYLVKHRDNFTFTLEPHVEGQDSRGSQFDNLWSRMLLGSGLSNNTSSGAVLWDVESEYNEADVEQLMVQPARVFIFSHHGSIWMYIPSVLFLVSVCSWMAVFVYRRITNSMEQSPSSETGSSSSIQEIPLLYGT
jgi:hypothetical protein